MLRAPAAMPSRREHRIMDSIVERFDFGIILTTRLLIVWASAGRIVIG